MRIEKRYYLDAKKEWDLLEEESGYDTDLTIDADSILKMHNKLIKTEKHSHDPKKVQNFKRLYQKAMPMAQCLNMDIIIEQKDTAKGTIKLIAPCLVLDSSFITEIHAVFCEMIQTADHIFIQPTEDMIELNFEFNLI